MPRTSRLFSLVALLVLAPATQATASVPAARPATGDLAGLKVYARQEGLPVSRIDRSSAQRLTIESHGLLARAVFIKRASLLAYVAFDHLAAPVQELEFHNHADGLEQTCLIRFTDYGLYIHDRISKAEYERRLGYRAEAEAPARSASYKLADFPPMPGTSVAPRLLPPAPKLVPPTTRVASVPTQTDALPGFSFPSLPSLPALPPSPLAPGLAPLGGFAYGVGLVNGAYDVYQAEYGYPLLPSLDLRPSLQILSPFSPLNLMAGASRPAQGLSVACDLLGTGRQTPGPGGLSFDGGLGARLGMMQGSSGSSNFFPAVHLKVGARWHWLEVAMRYPLMHATGDPTGGWETTVGVAWPLGQ